MAEKPENGQRNATELEILLNEMLLKINRLRDKVAHLERSNTESLDRIGTNLFESEWILRTYATLLVLSVPQWSALDRENLVDAFDLGRRVQHMAVATLAGYQAELAKYHESKGDK